MTEPENDAVILADPAAYTIDEVTAAFARATPQEVAAAQAVEREGKNRQRIVGYDPPALAAPAGSDRDEKHPVAGWQERAGWFEAIEGTRVSRHAIAGALADAKAGQTFSRAQVQRALEKFLKSAEEEAA